MITYTGQSVWPTGSEHDTGGVPLFFDIGVGLGRMPRFAGQVRQFYPVLAHTFTVADLVESDHRAFALLHDAPEAIVGDVPTTWKTDAARAAEADLLERMTRSAGLEWPWPEAAQADVKRADAIVLAAEAHALQHREADIWWPQTDWTDDHWDAFHATRHRLPAAQTWLDADVAGSAFRTAALDAIRPRPVALA